MTPVAPPDLKNPAPVGDAVAPPDVRNPAPVGEAPVEMPNMDLNSMYEDAASNGDPVSMYSLTSKVKGTPYEPVVKRSAEIMQKNLADFEKDVKPVMEAGGASTPQGRVAASKAFETIADKPQKMRAFVEMLMGNPKWRTFVTGGTPTTTVGYDKNGKQLEKTINELGQIVSVVDSETGQPIDRKQLADRGGFLTSLDNALGFQQQKEISGFNVKAFNAANAAVADFSAKAPVQKELYGEMRQRLQNLLGADLTPEQRQAIGAFTNRSMGYSQTVSQGLNALRQKVDNKNVSLSRQEQTAMESVLDKLGFKVGASGNVTKRNGEAVTKTDLDQAQDSLTNGAQFEKNFSQSKDDFIRSEVFKNLGEAEMKNLGRIIDLQGIIERNNLDLTGKHGNLPFLINPKSYQLGDEFARGEALALIGEFNQDAVEAFSKWRSRQLETYKRNGQVPNAGELEAAFSATPEFQRLKADYAEKNREILKRPTPERKAQETGAPRWDVDIGAKPAEQPKGVKSRSVKEPEKKPSARELAKTVGGRG